MRVTTKQQTRGRAKRQAKLRGMSVDAYLEKTKTHKWCCKGQHWGQREDFQNTIYGLSPNCARC